MDELAKRFADLAEKFGPSVADAALGAARIEAYSILAESFMQLGMSAVLLTIARLFWRKAKASNSSDRDSLYLGFGFAMGIGCLAMIPGIWAWIDPWTWTAISHPEIWIAKKSFHL